MAASFPRNLGGADRAARLALGLVLLGFALACPFAARQGALVVWASGLVGAVLTLTGLAGSCLLYTLLGVTTRKG